MGRKPRSTASKSAEKGSERSGSSMKKGSVDACVKLVEQFYEGVGLNPQDFRLTGTDKIGWVIRRGSATIFIHIVEYENLVTLRVYSPILRLPRENMLPFYRRLLEINMQLLSVAFGVYEDKVALISERPIAGLDLEEVAATVNHLSQVADDLDDALAKEFGASMLEEPH